MINNLLRNICLIVFALIGPISLPAGGIQKNLNQYKSLDDSKEILLESVTSLYHFPGKDSKKLKVLESGTPITILRNWKVNEQEIWVRVELSFNKIFDDPNMITKGWIKI